MAYTYESKEILMADRRYVFKGQCFFKVQAGSLSTLSLAINLTFYKAYGKPKLLQK